MTKDEIKELRARWTTVHGNVIIELLDEVERQQAAMADESGWMIELRGAVPMWWDAKSTSSFSPDPNDGVRFARKEDAAKVMHWQVAGDLGTFVTEHLWPSSESR